MSCNQRKQNSQACGGCQHHDQGDDFLVDFVFRLLMPFVHAKSSLNTLIDSTIIHYRPRPALRIMAFPPPKPA